MSRRAPPARPRPRLREVADLVGAGSSRAEVALGASADATAWTDIANTLDGLAFAGGSREELEPGAGGDGGAEALVEAGEGAADEDVFRREEGTGTRAGAGADVRDWLGAGDASLKRKVKLVSARDLKWVGAIPQAVLYAAARGCWRGDDGEEGGDLLPAWASGVSRGTAGSEESVGEGIRYLFARGLLHFRHPGAPLMSVVSSQWQTLFASARGGVGGAGAGGDGGGGEVQTEAIRRLEAWQEAFRSLFYGFRHAQVVGFYMVLSTTVVWFTAGVQRPTFNAGSKPGRQVGGTDGVSAVIAQATPGLVLQLEREGIPFTTVERGVGKENAAVGRGGLDDGVDDLGVDGLDGSAPMDKSDYSTGANASRPSKQQERLPTVVVEGVVDVHAFYNFLLEAGPRLGNAVDVPLLVADSPFAGAELTSCKIRQTKATRTAGGNVRQDLHVEGLLTQLQFSRLTEALHRAQHGEYTLLVETEARSEGVSQRPSVVSRVVSKSGSLEPTVYTREVT